MTAGAAPAKTYHVVPAVWGAEFIDLFLDVCIPNQLSPRNLPALPAGSRYRVFTKSADVARLSASARLDEVRRVLPVDIVEVDAAALDEKAKAGQIRNRYQMMIECHRRAVADAAEAEAALIFLAPDFVLAEGTIEALVRIHAAGSRAVLSTNLRLARYEFIAALAAQPDTRALAPRELVRLAMHYLHPATESLMVDGSSGNVFPTSVNWPVRSPNGDLEGVLVRSTHMHPMLLDPVRRAELPRGTQDGHYLMRSGVKLRQCHRVDDSDELVVFELTPSDRNIRNDGRRGGVSMSRLAAVASHCDRYQLSHWEHPVRLHSGDLDERWTAVEAASRQFARDLERYLPYGRMLFEIYRWLHIARQRRDRYARAVRNALRPGVTSKQIVRPAKLFCHRASKTLKLRLKRMRRTRSVVRTLSTRR